MELRRHFLPLVPVVFVLGAAILGAGFWLRHQQQSSLPVLMAHLPSQNAVLGFAHVEAIRASGLLEAEGAPPTHEPEYEAFIRKSGFNWEKDLDAVVWSSTPDARFFFATGRFDWERLRQFVVEEGGGCKDDFCTVTGSQPDRQISFFPWQSNVIAMAVSPDRYAADRLRLEYQHNFEPPSAPFWLHFTGGALRDTEPGAAGLKGFSRLLERADTATLFLQPSGEAFSLELRAQCPDPEKANDLQREFTKLTEWLNTLLRIEKQNPSDSEMAAVLSGGKFVAKGPVLEGSWPISRKFLGTLTGPATEDPPATEE